MRDQIDLINRIKIILPRQILFDTLIATNHDRLRMDSVKQSLDLNGYHIGDSQRLKFSATVAMKCQVLHLKI